MQVASACDGDLHRGPRQSSPAAAHHSISSQISVQVLAGHSLGGAVVLAAGAAAASVHRTATGVDVGMPEVPKVAGIVTLATQTAHAEVRRAAWTGVICVESFPALTVALFSTHRRRAAKSRPCSLLQAPLRQLPSDTRMLFIHAVNDNVLTHQCSRRLFGAVPVPSDLKVRVAAREVGGEGS